MSKNFDGFYWPNDKAFAVCLTHDVDRVKKTYQYFTHFVKQHRPYHLVSIFQKEEPYWNFGRITELENKYGVKSTFFFLHETKIFNLLPPKNWTLSIGRYDFHDGKIRGIIQKLYDNGWDIGLHGSYDSYINKDLLAREKRELEGVIGDEVIGIRQHYLNLETPKTWRIQHDVGFKYDASFGSKYKIGFREAEYHPFRPFDDDFLVIPLTIMEAVLFQLSPNIEDAQRRVIDIFDFAEKRKALVTVLWHQRFFNELEFPNYTKMYEFILQEGKRRNAWFTDCKGIHYFSRALF